MTETKTVPIKKDHYSRYVPIPKEWIYEFGLAFASEVVIEKKGSNPLNWEIKVKPAPVKKNGKPKGHPANT